VQGSTHVVAAKLPPSIVSVASLASNGGRASRVGALVHDLFGECNLLFLENLESSALFKDLVGRIGTSSLSLGRGRIAAGTRKKQTLAIRRKSALFRLGRLGLGKTTLLSCNCIAARTGEEKTLAVRRKSALFRLGRLGLGKTTLLSRNCIAARSGEEKTLAVRRKSALVRLGRPGLGKITLLSCDCIAARSREKETLAIRLEGALLLQLNLSGCPRRQIKRHATRLLLLDARLHTLNRVLDVGAERDVLTVRLTLGDDLGEGGVLRALAEGGGPGIGEAACQKQQREEREREAHGDGEVRMWLR
jgi:hypothetical protein